MSTKKNLLVLTSTFPRWQGDSEPPFVFELSRRLANHFDVMVLSPLAQGSKCLERMDNLDVHRFRYCFSGWQSLAYNGGILANLKQNRWRYLLVPLFIFFEFVSLLHLLRKKRVDVIHAHWLFPQGLVAVVARGMTRGKKPAIVCTSHGSDLLGLRGAMFGWLQKQVMLNADKVTFVGSTLRSRAEELLPENGGEVIPMGVDLTGVFTPSDSRRSDTELLFVGRLVEQKGLLYLIQAMPEILKSHPQVMLTIVGDGPAKESLQRQARSAGVNEHVSFMGTVENAALSELYGRAAVFVSPSLAEGFGITFVEALGCACPVVATDLPAIRDIVIDGVTGLVCRPKDWGDLAEKVCYLLDYPDLRGALGSAGRRHVEERFDWTEIASRYAALIDGVAQDRL